MYFRVISAYSVLFPPVFFDQFYSSYFINLSTSSLRHDTKDRACIGRLLETYPKQKK